MIKLRRSTGKRYLKIMLSSFPGYEILTLLLLVIKRRYPSLRFIDRLPIKKGSIVPVKYDDSSNIYLTHPERCSIAKKMYWDEGVREPTCDRIALDIFKSLSPKAEIILDIGANSGLFTLFAAKSSTRKRIIACDILPEAYHILCDNLMYNKLLPFVEVKLLGVGKSGGVFYAPFDDFSSEMATSLSLDSPRLTSRFVEIGTVSVDDMLDECSIQNGARILMKIDVEGGEFEVFDNAKKALSQFSFDIICEVLEISKSIEEYDALLSQYGYDKYLIKDRGLFKSEKIYADPIYKDWFITKECDVKSLVFGYL